MRVGSTWITLTALALGAPALALDIELPPNARQTVQRDSVLDRYLAPIGPYDYASGVPVVVVEGEVRRQAWRIASSGLTTLQVLVPLRNQLVDADYQVVLDCDQTRCGGFDFRFDTEALPAPNMRVNMRAYRFLTAVQGPLDAPTSVVTLMVSTTATAAFVQIVQAGRITAGQTATADAAVVSTEAPTPLIPATPFDERLLETGSIILRGLDFATGTTDLGAGPFPDLDALVNFMTDQPEVIIMLVGHTDSIGALDNNIALSRLRAETVRQRLIDEYGADANRLEAEGMGYLAPVASNLSAAGREANRRVEAVVLPAR